MGLIILEYASDQYRQLKLPDLLKMFKLFFRTLGLFEYLFMFCLHRHLQTKQALNSKHWAKVYERIIRDILRRSGYFNRKCEFFPQQTQLQKKSEDFAQSSSMSHDFFSCFFKAEVYPRFSNEVKLGGRKNFRDKCAASRHLYCLQSFLNHFQILLTFF